MSFQIAITGTGLITPLGASVRDTFHALLAGRFISDHSVVDASEVVARSRVARLAIRASLEAWESSGWGKSTEPFALIIGTSKGPVEQWIAPARLSDVEDPCVYGWGLSELAMVVRRILPVDPSIVHTLSAACASGLHAIIYAAMLLRSGIVRRALVVGAEASVHPLFLGSFQRLGVLARPEVGCRPFDESREGFLMSDAAGAVCLEKFESPERAARPVVFVDRFALAGDAAHLTSADAQGQTMRIMLAQVIDHRPVDLVHAHGTGTATNDPLELAAIESQLADPNSPWLYSHKGAIGHTLGAAGIVATVLSAEMHGRRIILPNVQTRNPISHRQVQISSEPVSTPISRSIAIASGFGGALGAISLVSA